MYVHNRLNNKKLKIKIENEMKIQYKINYISSELNF